LLRPAVQRRKFSKAPSKTAQAGTEHVIPFPATRAVRFRCGHPRDALVSGEMFRRRASWWDLSASPHEAALVGHLYGLRARFSGLLEALLGAHRGRGPWRLLGCLAELVAP
jgi:hypothetical protein